MVPCKPIFTTFWKEQIKALDLEDKKSLAHLLLESEFEEDRFIG